MITETVKLLGALARCLGFVCGVTLGVCLAAYIIAGVAFNGDWERVNKAVERAYHELAD